mmetsp:Transcript_31097/g.51366  ORF Transcript_31097/g.51366 Transcript_31097/m.51366 type:complete len:288 (-) Transcript_31097:123-986(-)|eukprot:CAMPEP_0119006102 /NCGR_PEP_ID=MMETSP1176-20130426/2113_1 /TAXON_ID=265551 /ORGANISM="Synedropsis recta cf, Strain CCMP1620" /LENGTH=287 /DNA_ID=CAMNT_0006957989 /DNA_START=92 /DNA_END=955 /DNA_ORIENTATION=-
MTEQSIYFQFLGNNAEVPTRTICVCQTALQKHPESLLCKLADAKWKKKTFGSKANPIVTKPFEFQHDDEHNWLPNIACMIEEFYNEDKLELPQHVELEEALTMLDFYGLPVEERPGTSSICLDKTDLMTRLRAKVFLEHTENYDKTVKAIVEQFEKKPELKKNFLFVHSHHETSKIHESNSMVFTILPYLLIDPSFQWVQSTRLRNRMVTDLEAMGFEIVWTPNASVAVAGPSRGNDYDNREERTDNLNIATVKIGDPEPLSKRQKINHQEEVMIVAEADEAEADGN